MPITGPLVYGPNNLDFYDMEVAERLEEVSVSSRAYYGQANASGNAYMALRILANRELKRGQAIINIRERFTRIGRMWTCHLTGTICNYRPKVNTAVRLSRR